MLQSGRSHAMLLDNKVVRGTGPVDAKRYVEVRLRVSCKRKSQCSHLWLIVDG